MFFPSDSPEIRYTGRFGLLCDPKPRMTATACGAMIDFAFTGREAMLHFYTDFSYDPRGHVYLSVDGGARVEATIDPFIRVNALTGGTHTVNVIYKGSVEQQNRWRHPLMGKLSFLGFTADGIAPLAEDTRKTIEIVGDSITEGVLIDAYQKLNFLDQHNRPWQDDVTATYGWLTAEALDLRPFMMGYGAVGNTHGGCGGVPKTADAYPFNFEGSPVTYPSCDCILINHGANDRGRRDDYLPEYRNLLKLIRARNPRSKLIVLSPFCGAFDDVLPDFIAYYNMEENDSVLYVSSHGWVPAEPLHPLRDGHRTIADRLIPILRENGIG